MVWERCSSSRKFGWMWGLHKVPREYEGWVLWRLRLSDDKRVISSLSELIETDTWRSSRHSQFNSGGRGHLGWGVDPGLATFL